ncbi:hypothetical protein K7X08_032325 [Anisodus acutangulus]|uniref:Uncharacterized protein n=1 Tax=Anisodus acutangulus TaxID=402998 RepID=A0A9Q1M045_9SOLA|nr:hypothetical protein K7X08_032325 [Anisodus acutangulus]
MQLIEKFPSYVKETLKTTLEPHKENLEAVREEQKKLQRIMTKLSALDPLKIVLLRPILPPRAYLFSTQPRVSTEPRVDPSTKRDDVEEDQTMDDDDDKTERQSESDPDSDEGDDPLASARSVVRVTCIAPDEIDTVVVMQWSVEQL